MPTTHAPTSEVTVHADFVSETMTGANARFVNFTQGAADHAALYVYSVGAASAVQNTVGDQTSLTLDLRGPYGQTSVTIWADDVEILLEALRSRAIID